MRFMQGLNGDITVAEFREMMKPELFEKVVESLGKLRGAGYRTRLINKYEGIIEWNVYGYMRYEGLSPFAFQNFAYNYYSIDQINTFGIPTRMEFTLDKKLLFEDKPGKDLIVFDNPFDIRTLPKESLHLHQMFEKFPVSILSADIGVLSRNKLLIIDLYEQQRVAEGEKSGDEYEFHILRFEKVCPKDLERFDRDLEYQRFMDVNFKYEQYNWVLSDVDQFMSYLPITS
jgi:hypothetical protein